MTTYSPVIPHPIVTKFEKDRTALKYYMIGRGYVKALKAMGFAEKIHRGFRKDGYTPEFYHQVGIALAITELKGLINEERCLVVAFLHDVMEPPYNVARQVIVAEFGEEEADSVWRTTKKHEDLVKHTDDYLNEMAGDPCSSIVKGRDRNNNLQSMLGVFNVPKMKSYINDARNIFLPMLKTASKLFPEQHQAYQTISNNMKQQCHLLEAYIQMAEAYEARTQQVVELSAALGLPPDPA